MHFQSTKTFDDGAYGRVRQIVISEPQGFRLLASPRHRRLPQDPEALVGEILHWMLASAFVPAAAAAAELRVWMGWNDTRFEARFEDQTLTERVHRLWAGRREMYEGFLAATLTSRDQAVRWASRCPGIDKAFQPQLLLGLGLQNDVSDCRDMCRMAGLPDRAPRPGRREACWRLCAQLALKSGSSVAMVDSVLLLAFEFGVLETTGEGSAYAIHDLPLPRLALAA